MEKSSTIIVLLLSIFLCYAFASAQPRQSFPPLDGWTHFPAYNIDTPERHGIGLSGTSPSYSKPVVSDIDGDALNGLEVAVASSDGTVYVFKNNGQLLWSQELPSHDCPNVSITNRLHASPKIGNLFGDNIPYLVMSYGSIGGSCDGGVAAFKGADGSPVWTFSTKNWAKKQKYSERFYGVFSTPALADTDHDGRLEIGFGSLDRNVYLLNANGTVRWYYNAADTVLSSPEFADINGDQRQELIIGTDISANRRLRPPTKNGGYLYAFKTNKPRSTRSKRISFRNSKAYFWLTSFDQAIQSSPQVAEILSSNPGKEIVLSSSCIFPQGSSNKLGRWLKILSLKNGKVIKTLNSSACSSSTPALGDIDGDTNIEIVAAANGHASLGGDGRSRLHAWKPAETEPFWSVIPNDGGSNDPYGGDHNFPSIADLDGDGLNEVIVGNNAFVGVYSGLNGSALSCQSNACDANKYSMYAWRPLKSSPTVADINQDGKLDVIVGGTHAGNPSHGSVFAWRDFAGRL